MGSCVCTERVRDGVRAVAHTGDERGEGVRSQPTAWEPGEEGIKRAPTVHRAILTSDHRRDQAARVAVKHAVASSLLHTAPRLDAR